MIATIIQVIVSNYNTLLAHAIQVSLQKWLSDERETEPDQDCVSIISSFTQCWTYGLD